MYVKVTNGFAEIYSIGKLRKDNPNTSFPKNPSEALLAEWSVFPYTDAEKPTYNTKLQYLTRKLNQVDGAWVYDYVVNDYTAQEIADNLTKARANAVLTRQQFCTNCYTAGLLSKDDAVLAAKGGWPAAFTAALSGLTEEEQAVAEIEWASVQTVRRNAPLLAVVQASSSVNDAELDALFGI